MPLSPTPGCSIAPRCLHQTIPQLDIGKFLSDLTERLARMNGLGWSPTLIYQPLLRICNPDNEALLDSIEIVAMAINAISAVEIYGNLEEFSHLLNNLAPSFDEFRNFFASSVVGSFLRNYSPFNFLRYLSYVITFSFYCCWRSYFQAPDFAVLAILEVVDKWRIFDNLRTWENLVEESWRVASPDFALRRNLGGFPLTVQHR